MAKCFLVMGVPRSGTSAVAGVLHALGVCMGWKTQEGYDWPDPNEWNPKGFYQDAPLENAQDAMLGDGFPLPGTAPDPAMLGRFRELVRARCRGHDWGAKTSRMQWCLPEFLGACTDDVHLVITRRMPEQSAASWAARAKVPMTEAEEIVRRCTAQLERALAEVTLPRLTVEFDALLDGDALKLLADFAGRPLTREARSFVDPSLRRF